MNTHQWEKNAPLLLVSVVLIIGGCLHQTNLPLLTAYSGDERPILITGVDLFTGKADEAVRENVHILIEDGRIARISDEPIAAPKARVIPADGKMIMPGLIDSHVHVVGSGAPPQLKALPNPERNLTAFLYAGITTVVDTGGPPETLKALADRVECLELAGPRLIYAGKILARSGGHPAAMIRNLAPWPLNSLIIADIMFELEDDADIPVMVRENKAEGARFTKLVVDQIPLKVPSLNAQQVARIVSAAREEGMETVAHIGSEEDILTCLEGGIHVFIHGPYRSRLSEETIQRMKRGNCIVIPTVAVFDNLEIWAQNRPYFSSLDAEITDPVILAAYREPVSEETTDPRMTEWLKEAIRHETEKFDITARMKVAGMVLLAGSDSINVASSPGATLHREMELLATRCGFTPEEAVAAATSIPGHYYAGILGIPGLGCLEEGAPADLVILNGDFRKDITRTRDIHEVIIRGKRVERRTPDHTEL
ncbi:MAG: amidohydrolase family protein [Thermodesulfobacteriota bacterium]